MNGQNACGCRRVPSSARDTRGWYPRPHPGSQTKATILWSAAEAISVVHLGQQARGPRLVPPTPLSQALFPLRRDVLIVGKRWEGQG